MEKSHKSDYGFPRLGEISLAGVLHLPYFGVSVATCALCLWHFYEGNLNGPVLWGALAGGAGYIICFAADLLAGNFAPLKKISESE